MSSAAAEPVFKRRRYRFITPPREVPVTLLKRMLFTESGIYSHASVNKMLASCQEQKGKKFTQAPSPRIKAMACC